MLAWDDVSIYNSSRVKKYYLMNFWAAYFYLL